jgi:Flp pilus assembly protein TadB
MTGLGVTAGAGAVDALVLGLLCSAASLPWCLSGASARLGAVGSLRVAWIGEARTVSESSVARGAPVDLLVVLALLDVALGSGASVTRALVTVGTAVGGDDGHALGTVAAALSLGADWHGAWAQAPPVLRPAEECLRGSWTVGSAAGPALRAAAAQIRRRRRRESREAAGRLSVQLVLPLGLCFLPACVLLGLAPLIVSLAADLGG